MNLTINGTVQNLPDGTTVAQLLERLELAPIRVAVEVNEELVARRDFEAAALRDGDRMEIVTLVGGG